MACRTCNCARTVPTKAWTRPKSIASCWKSADWAIAWSACCRRVAICSESGFGIRDSGFQNKRPADWRAFCLHVKLRNLESGFSHPAEEPEHLEERVGDAGRGRDGEDPRPDHLLHHGPLDRVETLGRAHAHDRG